MKSADRAALANEWDSQGQSCIASGQLARAVEYFERATEANPGAAVHWARLGKVQASLRDYDAAANALQRACALAPRTAGFHVLLGHILREQNQPGAAVEAFELASAADPANLHAAVGAALVLPAVYGSVEETRAWRERFAQGLAQLRARASRLRPRDVLQLEWNNFYLAYQGENDRELQSAYSDLIADFLAIALPGFQQPLPTRPTADRINVGFVSSEFRQCTIGAYFLHWVSDLPRDRFRVSVIHTGAVADSRTAEFARVADHFVRFSGTTAELVTLARDRKLDAVVYPDVGMSAQSTLLANLRLAPVQLAAWGHPVSTGSRFVDHYLSCAEMEPADAPAHYRESLVLLPGIGVRYPPPERIPGAGVRERLGIRSGSHVYVCPQSLYKIHPDNDELLAEVIARDPDGVLLFFAGETRGQTNAFFERLSGTMRRVAIAPRNQVKVLPILPRKDFLEILAAADAMLDTVHWSGGSTSLDAIAVDLPIVTLPGAQMRGRQSAAMLEIMGLRELVARGRDDYVRLALRLAGDETYRADVVARMRAGRARLFDRREVSAAFAESLLRLATPVGGGIGQLSGNDDRSHAFPHAKP